MMTRLWSLCLVVTLTAFSLVAAGCGEVDHCEKGKTRGCLDSPPLDGGVCLYDLVRYNIEGRGEVCLKQGSDEDPCKLCAAGALCVPEEGRCVPFCEAPDVLPGSGMSPEPISCRAFTTDPNENPMLPFDEICRRRCRLECQRLEQFCGAGCPQGMCDGADVQAKCASDCPMLPTGGPDLSCLTEKCEEVQLARCETDLVCPNGSKVDCAQFTCTNDCIYPADGTCDDGDVIASDTNDCAWGSDCADCGPRKGPKPVGYIGSVCQYHSNCSGGTMKPSTATAWCVQSETLPGVNRCAPDCSRDQDCGDGFVCREVLVAQSDGSKQPIVEGDLRGQACFPLMCL